jgi:hypothetical protein
MSDQWNGGAGTDRIIVRSGDLSDGSFSLITQTQSNLSNIEQLAVQDVFVGTVDLQHFAAVGIDQYFFAGSSGGAALNFGGLSNTLTFTADALGDLTLDHVGLGVSDSIAFVLNNADVNGVLTINDFETINIVSIGGANTITGALSPFATGGGFAPVTVTGTTALTLAGTSEAQVLNAGAFTANLTMSDFFGTDLTAVPGPTGATITGGSGNDRLVGEIDPARPDTVGGGIGNDLIYGTPINFDGASNTSGDVLTGGAGSDVFVFEGEDEGSTLRISSGTTRLTHITDFAAGIDKIAIVNDFANYTSFVLDGTQTIGTAANLAAVYAAIAAIPASAGGGALHGAFIVVSGGGAAGSYLYVNDAFGGVSNTDDMLLNLTGISGTFSAGDVSLIGPPVV